MASGLAFMAPCIASPISTVLRITDSWATSFTPLSAGSDLIACSTPAMPALP
ncbi:hypothetical protein D3C86_1833450 [compost metagenome]